MRKTSFIGALLSAIAPSSAIGFADEPRRPLPCRQPQLAAAGKVVYLACGNGSTISVAKSDDGGRSFGALTTLATVGALSLGNHRGPRVVGDGVNPALAISAHGPVVAWNASNGLVVTTSRHEPQLLDAAGKFVALTATAYGVLAAWETGDGAATRLIDADGR